MPRAVKPCLKHDGFITLIKALVPRLILLPQQAEHEGIFHDTVLEVMLSQEAFLFEAEFGHELQGRDVSPPDHRLDAVQPHGFKAVMQHRFHGFRHNAFCPACFIAQRIADLRTRMLRVPGMKAAGPEDLPARFIHDLEIGERAVIGGEALCVFLPLLVQGLRIPEVQELHDFRIGQRVEDLPVDRRRKLPEHQPLCFDRFKGHDAKIRACPVAARAACVQLRKSRLFSPVQKTGINVYLKGFVHSLGLTCLTHYYPDYTN